VARAHDDDILPSEAIDRLVAPLERFLHVEAAGGIVLLLSSLAALALANSPWAEAFLGFWKTPVALSFGAFEMSHPLKHWVSDGAMSIFFFVVGLEVKRELVLGSLRDPRRAALPVAAALGGMVVPAGIYLALHAGLPTARGWGIPMATDIAFVVGCMAVLGSRVPLGLRVMLLSLAIADDVGAVAVIAIGYTGQIQLPALALGVGASVAIAGLERLGARSLLVYTLLGICVWLAFHESGVHATLAGVLLGLQTPARTYLSDTHVANVLERASALLRGGEWRTLAGRAARVRRLARATRESLPPVEYLEARLHPWVGFAIVPLFALANAGVPISAGRVTDPVAVAVAAGLVVGKPVGILLASALAVRLGLTRLPEGVGWAAVAGAGCLAGIGFTMALFIAGLALEGAALDAAKVGILGGSLVSALLGFAILVRVLPPAAGKGA